MPAAAPPGVLHSTWQLYGRSQLQRLTKSNAKAVGLTSGSRRRMALAEGPYKSTEVERNQDLRISPGA